MIEWSSGGTLGEAKYYGRRYLFMTIVNEDTLTAWIVAVSDMGDDTPAILPMYLIKRALLSGNYMCHISTLVVGHEPKVIAETHSLWQVPHVIHEHIATTNT